MRQLSLLPLLLVCLSGFGQRSLEEIADSITKEGKKLYASERTSWDGTDIFVTKFTETDKIGGYFSYRDHDHFKCIFYSKDEKPRVIGCVAFDTTHAVSSAQTDLTVRDFTPDEYPIYRIRAKALEMIKTDTFFRKYKNTDVNLIPLIDGGGRRVVVLTGPKQSGVMLLGNDYEIRFDDKDEVIDKRRLHHNIIAVNYGPSKDGKTAEGAIHSHNEETGPFITATDICTLMLYERMARWKTHVVVSKEYVCLWTCESDSLLILTMEAWKKMVGKEKD